MKVRTAGAWSKNGPTQSTTSWEVKCCQKSTVHQTFKNLLLLLLLLLLNALFKSPCGWCAAFCLLRRWINNVSIAYLPRAVAMSLCVLFRKSPPTLYCLSLSAKRSPGMQIRLLYFLTLNCMCLHAFTNTHSNTSYCLTLSLFQNESRVSRRIKLYM